MNLVILKLYFTLFLSYVRCYLRSLTWGPRKIGAKCPTPFRVGAVQSLRRDSASGLLRFSLRFVRTGWTTAIFRPHYRQARTIHAWHGCYITPYSPGSPAGRTWSIQGGRSVKWKIPSAPKQGLPRRNGACRLATLLSPLPQTNMLSNCRWYEPDVFLHLFSYRVITVEVVSRRNDRWCQLFAFRPSVRHVMTGRPDKPDALLPKV